MLLPSATFYRVVAASEQNGWTEFLSEIQIEIIIKPLVEQGSRGHLVITSNMF